MKEKTWFKDLMRLDEFEMWTGKPEPGKLLSKEDAYLIPFSVVWAGFAIFWTIGAIVASGSAGVALYGMVFVAIGLYMSIGRLIVKAYKNSNTFYVITNQRIIINESNRIRSVERSHLPDFSTELFPDGTGNIYFASGTETSGYSRKPSDQTAFTLRHIKDVDSVSQLISKESIL
ncbi:MAG: hypothetical protein K6G69_04265 [Lachnospiraceae bacterium]|nr:hypothetical protein [Lachnospiraceae bacterium]